jgi:hypothetical protein
MTLRQLSHLNIQLPLPKAPVPRKLLHAVGRDHHLRVRGGNPFHHITMEALAGQVRYRASSGGSGRLRLATRLPVC